MSEKTAGRTREKWVDDVKVIACILVVLGHFFQSMTKANILPENDLYGWFNTTIYYFHVPLFFICSGYLYQKYSKVNSVGSWCKNVAKKALALGVPYATFTTATWVLKKVFSSSVNDQIGGLGNTLLLHPTAPYWYLYALFFIFLVTPTFSSVKSAAVGLIVALAAKVLILTGGDSVYAVSTVLSNEIWFVIGMSICSFNVQLKGRKIQGTIFGLLFVILSIVVYTAKISGSAISFAIGLLACVAVIMMVAGFEEKFGRGMKLLAKYTMPIFLMHTLFAAPLRSILMKIGIENAVIHVVLGLVISFSGPIIAAWIMKKTKWLEFFLYPNKFVKVNVILLNKASKKYL
ncbi:acyltransferase family protein [Holdemanella porci]|uniref:acyltransferase family protein n=1 Tax=Holdemanella porci TaxID=2652276 RepID=UPI003F924014